MKKKTTTPTNNYPWLVLHDPEGMYTGPFHRLDLQLTAQAGFWPEGIIFQHKRTQKKLIFQQGSLSAYPEERDYDTQH